MRKTVLSQLALPLALLVAMLFATPAAAQTLGEGWYRQWGLGQQARLARQMPAVVYLYSTRAIPCKTLEQEVFPHPEVAPLLAKFTRIAINHVDNEKLLAELGVTRVPTLILQDSKGRELDRAVGIKDVATLAAILTRVLEVHGGGRDASTLNRTVFDLRQPRANTAAIPFRIHLPNASRVTIVADFNDWRADENPLLRQRDGTWAIDLYLSIGVYEYLFLVDGDQFVMDSTNPLRKPNPFGGFNSAVVVGTPIVSPRVEGRSATFLVYDPNAAVVEIAGSFTNWQRRPMFRNTADPGMWGVKYDLPPGTYQYKFVIDGNWIVDPENLQPLPDGQGNINSAFFIPPDGAAPATP
jgi:hypothetical protein